MVKAVPLGVYLQTRAMFEPETGCWLWTGNLNSKGYANGHAHVRTYLRTGKIIPEGMELDHTCRCRRCINPEHLEPVTHQENIRRAHALGAYNYKKGPKQFCKKGHPLVDVHVRSDGTRLCRICKIEYAERMRLHYNAKRLANRRKRKIAMTAEATAAQLIDEHFLLKDKLKSAQKIFDEIVSPHKRRLEEIDNQLLQLLNEHSGGGAKASISTDSGTAYVSNLLNVSIDPEAEPYVNEGGESQVGRMALLDFALENWADIGADLLLVSPQKDAVKRWMEEHGKPPPGLKISYFSRVNVRRS